MKDENLKDGGRKNLRDEIEQLRRIVIYLYREIEDLKKVVDKHDRILGDE